MKKIICPVDFSEPSFNAIEYAAKLAQVLNAEIKIINVQLLLPQMILNGNSRRAPEWVKMINDKLENISTETSKMFKVSCSYEIILTKKTLQKTIAGKTKENNLIVMGTNGADDVYQYFFGTNTYNVIKKAKCPVLMVPENSAYGTPRKIVFAWDYTIRNKFSFKKIKYFFNTFNPLIIFLHISRHKTEISKDVFRAAKDEFISAFNGHSDLEFEKIYSDDIPSNISHYMEKSKAQMLVITYYDRGLIQNVFHGKVAKELSETADYPILVLHE